MIVVLDVNFSKGELSGWEVFRSIRDQTSLIYVIFITADELIKLNQENLKFLINHDAFALEDVTADYSRIVSLVKNAAHKLDTRVDSALEHWIALHPENEKNSPYITSRDGRTYTLNELLKEIRKQSQFGMEMEKDILVLAIDMLSRGKKKIDG